MCKENEVMVSVFCTAYNHGKYIRECLEGFVKQKTNFKFEVLINDDASTDNTASIIREYEEKYPDIIKPIYQKENQYSKGVNISKQILIPMASESRYIAFCEGDDFWTDELKLQKQFDALESNCDCKMCVCKVRATNEDSSLTDKTYPHNIMPTGVISQDMFFKYVCKEYVFQTSSYFFNAEDYKVYLDNPPKFRQVAVVGDWPMLLYFGTLGDVYYISDEMSCYRRNSIGSYSTELHKAKSDKVLKYYRAMINMMDEFDLYTNYVYHDYCNSFDFRSYYFYYLIKEKMYREAIKKEFRAFLKKENFRNRTYIRIMAYIQFIKNCFKRYHLT